MTDIWDMSSPAFRQYALCSAVLAIKMIAMAFLTSKQRITKKAFANIEDARMDKSKVKMADPDVERVRRAHLNDLENIPVFWILGLLYLMSDPSLFCAKVCFYGFTACRLVHTVSYLYGLQPHRALGFLIGTIINLYMAGCIIFKCL